MGAMKAKTTLNSARGVAGKENARQDNARTTLLAKSKKP